jgi:hypothetical protein
MEVSVHAGRLYNESGTRPKIFLSFLVLNPISAYQPGQGTGSFDNTMNRGESIRGIFENLSMDGVL